MPKTTRTYIRHLSARATSFGSLKMQMLADLPIIS